MNVRNLVPLGLTIAIAASLAACGRTKPPGGQCRRQAGLRPVADQDAADLAQQRLDPAIPACTDLNGFVNNKWLKANPVPGDQTTWGSFEILRERSLEVQHALVQQAAASQAKGGLGGSEIGDIWKTGNDEAKDRSCRPGAAAAAAGQDHRAERHRRHHPVPARQPGRGQGVLFSLVRQCRLQGFGQRHRLRRPGWPGPAGEGLLLRRCAGQDPRRLRGLYRTGADPVRRGRGAGRRAGEGRDGLRNPPGPGLDVAHRNA